MQKLAPLSVHGILLLDKPPNMSSNAALQRVKRLYNAKKAGHTGSLDPIATGMLPICFGDATKFSQFLLDSNKSYEVEATLGVQTATADTEGAVIEQKSYQHIDTILLEQVLAEFIGEIQQMPPMYSAIKHKGKPLYHYARQGIEVARPSRCVRIFSLQLLQLQGDCFKFNLHCSKGTYVRTLVEDICARLNTVGHIKNLRRTMVNAYTQEAMHTLTDIETLYASGGMTALRLWLLPAETAIQAYPAIKISTATAFYLRQGQTVRVPHTVEATTVRIYSEQGQFLGVGVLEQGYLKPERLIAQG